MEQLDLFSWRPRKRRRRKKPCEWKVVSVRESPAPETMPLCDTPEKAVAYWRTNIATGLQFNPEAECFAVLLLNVRDRIRGHQIVSLGSLNETLIHPREVFRTAVIAAAFRVVIMHHHPSGEPQPSEADLKVTKELVAAGELLKIEVLDHIIVGHNRYCSLREQGQI